MKSDNSKIKLRWELQQTGAEDTMDAGVKAAGNRHPHISRILKAGRSALGSQLDALGPRMIEAMRYDFPLTADSIVLDCGGYRGDWTAEIYGKYHCTIHVFEPVAAFYDKISARFRGLPRIHVHNFGVSNWDTDTAFGIQNDSTGQFSDSSVCEMVKLSSIERVFDLCAAPRIHLLKLNIEGGEFAVIESLLNTGLISRVDNLLVQFHECAPDSDKRYEAIQERLPETHFLTFYTGWQWQNWRRTT